jgi:hypothetical protein
MRKNPIHIYFKWLPVVGAASRRDLHDRYIADSRLEAAPAKKLAPS